MTEFIHVLVYIGVVLMSCTWKPGETLIFDSSSQCVVAPPCNCKGSDIGCYRTSLTSIPTIMPFSTAPSSTLYFNFIYNNISDISANAFRSVTAADDSSIQMNLKSNMITAIADQAFNGIEHVITELYLQYNKLTSIPSAIGHLVNLQNLELRGNPLQTLDAQVLVQIYGSLHNIYISIGNMTSWPDEIHVLRELQLLYIDDINLRTLPVDAFYGIGTNLQTLALISTNLERIPENICNMKNLRLFTFSSNSMFNGNNSLQTLCNAPLTELTDLSLRNDNIHTFPEGIFAIFPNLATLSLDSNNLRYIPFKSVPTSNHVTTLRLNNNMFGSIPSAVNRFQMLQKLYLNGNQIYNIDQYDLVGLLHLSYLDISSNPLEYIDDIAFHKQNNTLTDLHLGSTHLDTVPSAVTSLSRLSDLNMYIHPNIKCSCDNMSHLRSWNVARVTISGRCESGTESIKEYIITSLPNCPVK